MCIKSASSSVSPSVDEARLVASKNREREREREGSTDSSLESAASVERFGVCVRLY